MDICKCGHPLEDHAGHAPHYCHADCECNAYIQADPADRKAAITSAERAVIEAANRASWWRHSSDCDIYDEQIRKPCNCGLETMVAAVDALIAAREG